MTYAAKTDVPVERSRGEIEKLLTKYGATSFMSGQSGSEAMIAFEMQNRRIMFRLPLPPKPQRFETDSHKRTWEQSCRSRWRAMVLSIKAKLEAVAIGITTFEDEWMAHIVMPDGRTVSDHARPRIALAYERGEVPALFGPSSSKETDQ